MIIISYNNFIFRHFIKNVFTSPEFYEATLKIVETVVSSPTYIKKTDDLKQKIEDKTGIHINKYFEDEYEKYLTYDDPRLDAIIEEFNITDESASRRLAEDIKAEKEERRKGLIPAILANILIWSFIFKMIFGLFQC